VNNCHTLALAKKLYKIIIIKKQKALRYMVGDGHQWNLVQSGQDIRPHLAAAIRTDGKKGRSGRRGGVAPGWGMQHI